MSRRRSTEVENFAISYADMVTLLLVFFIYLYSISTIDKVKFMQGKDAVSKQMNRKVEVDNKLLDQIQIEQQKLKEMQEKINAYIQQEHLENLLSVNYDRDHLELNLGNALLFTLGSADLKDEAGKILIVLGDLFKSTESKIIVEGHTDDRPIHTSQFPSNWELSAARAAAVVHFLETQNIPGDRFLVMGYNQYAPLAPNDNDENRSKNRRVKIILKPDIAGLMDKTKQIKSADQVNVQGNEPQESTPQIEQPSETEL